jgi:hypothetical protein
MEKTTQHSLWFFNLDFNNNYDNALLHIQKITYLVASNFITKL